MDAKYKNLFTYGILMYTFYYAYDLPASLNYYIDFSDNINKEKKISLLYTAYSAPNIFMPLIFIKISNKNRLSVLMILSIFVFIGQLSFSYGISTKSFLIMVVGRVLLGCGCEPYLTMQNEMIGEDFKYGVLSSALIFYNVLGRLGTISNFMVSPIIAKHYSPFISSILSLSFIGLSLSFCYNNAIQRELSSTTNEKVTNETLKYNSFNEIDELKEVENQIIFEYSNYPDNESRNNSFCFTFIFLCALHFLFAMIWTPYYNIIPFILQTKYKMSKVESGHALGFLEGISIIFSILSVPLAEKYNCRILLIFIGLCLLSVAHMIIIFSQSAPFYALFFLGVSAPNFLYIWSFVPSIVQNNFVSVAYAIMFCFSNLAATISSLSYIFFLNKDSSFLFLEIYTLILLFFALCCHSAFAYSKEKNGLLP